MGLQRTGLVGADRVLSGLDAGSRRLGKGAGPRSVGVVCVACVVRGGTIDCRAIKDRGTGQLFTSGLDDAAPSDADVAYVGRVHYRGASLFLIAGIHAIGSVGAVHFLAGHAADLYATVRDGYWSGIVGSTHDGETITGSEWVCAPRRHE